MYVAQPSEKGKFEGAKWREKDQNYRTFETNYYEQVAQQRASELNEEEQSEQL